MRALGTATFWLCQHHVMEINKLPYGAVTSMQNAFQKLGLLDKQTMQVPRYDVQVHTPPIVVYYREG